MGLDAVEIVMEVEEAFGITLEDSEVENISTPRDLIDLIMTKVGKTASAGCLTQRAFHQVRAAMLRQLPLQRREISPTAHLARLAPRNQRKVLMECLAAELETGPLPALVRPKWLVNGLAAICIVLAIVGSGWIFRHGLWAHRGAMFGTAVALAAALAFLANAATKSCRFDFPPRLATVGDLSRWLVAHKTELAVTAPGKWTREQVAARIRDIVIEQLDCAPAYREEASFVQDLGAG